LQLLVETSRELIGLSTNVSDITHADRLLRGTTCRYAPAELLEPIKYPSVNAQPVGQLIDVEVERTDGVKLSVAPAQAMGGK
jgi:hypothetical protein